MVVAPLKRRCLAMTTKEPVWTVGALVGTVSSTLRRHPRIRSAKEAALDNYAGVPISPA